MQPSLSLVINAGGQSRRMGQDKARLPIPPTNEPLIAHIYHRLQPLGFDKTIIVTNNQALQTQVHFSGPVHHLPDAHPDAGALGGIATGLAHCPEWGLFVACDMPLLNPTLLAKLCQFANGSRPDASPASGMEDGPWDAIVPIVAGRKQTLHALYHRRCLPAIHKKIKAGQLRVTSFYSEMHIRFVTEEEVRSIDPDLHSFFNANTPEEWAYALRLLSAYDE